MRATEIIREEHRALAAILHGLRHLSQDAVQMQSALDFELLDLMVHYIDGVPERVHHPKEDLYLFPIVIRHAPELTDAIAELETQHARGRALLAGLNDALHAFRQRGLDGAQAFADVVETYADFHWKHMRLEEERVLAYVDERVPASELAQLAHAFAENAEADVVFRDLFRRIASIAPEPIGVAARKPRPGLR